MTTNNQTQTQTRRRRMAGALLVAAGAAVAGALGSASPAHADEYTYLAIVYSPATGAYGWANGSDTPANLYNRAMGYCQSYGGTDCRLLGDAVNSCAALAVHVGEPGRYRAEFNYPNRLQADFNALRINKGGRIVLSRCSTGDDGIG
jgi:Domain of unknown function (DUF4189)